MKRTALLSAAVAGLVALGGAQNPSALATTSGGYWEVIGVPGSGPIRQCIGNTRPLTQFEHRRETCQRTTISDSADRAVVEYVCPSGGFGRSEVTVLTPRSLRVETQGISGGLPFHYVLQARRLGECSAH
jgi:hypothetical protein